MTGTVCAAPQTELEQRAPLTVFYWMDVGLKNDDIAKSIMLL